MNKLTLLFFLLTSYIFSNINAIVSIVPEKTFLKAIGGDKVNVSLMVQMGNSPHTYEPKPSQMISVSNAALYFAIGVEFEHVWLPKFQSLNKKMKIIHLDDTIQKLPMQNLHHTHHNEDANTDPHIWTAPSNVKRIAENIYHALVSVDANNTEYYKQNLKTFLSLVATTDTEIKQTLSTLKENRAFMVFHPSWAYFAKEYHLQQIVMEIEGKSPKPRELVRLIKEAKEKKVKAIFTQPEFSDNAAKIIANELHVPVVKVSPMAANWSDNLKFIAHKIAGKK